MSIRIQVAAEVRASVPRAAVRRIARALERAGARLGIDSARLAELGVRIVGDEEIAALRLRHLGLVGPTDVLSFPAAEGDDSGLDHHALGDLVVAWPLVQRQSVVRGCGASAWAEEAADLCIHGLVHLLGHDHGSRAEGRAMLRLEQRAARTAGVALGPRPYGARR